MCDGRVEQSCDDGPAQFRLVRVRAGTAVQSVFEDDVSRLGKQPENFVYLRVV